jgi:hypothetical protein
MKKFILLSSLVLSFEASAGLFEGEEILSDKVVSVQNCESHLEEVSMAMGGGSPVQAVPANIYTLVIERQIEKEAYKKSLLMKKKENSVHKVTINKSEVLTFKSEFKGHDSDAQKVANQKAFEACQAERHKLAQDDSDRSTVVDKPSSDVQKKDKPAAGTRAE